MKMEEKKSDIKNEKPKQHAKEKKPAKPKRTYPNVLLEDCLIIAQKIKELNGGNT